MPPLPFLSVFWQILARNRAIKDAYSRPKAPGVAVEAAELQGAIFLLPCRVEEEQGDALEGDLGLWQVLSLKRNNTGLSVVGEGITLLACVHWQGGLKKATEVAGHLEVLAKDLIILHQVFSLRAAGDIVKNLS